MRFLRIVEFGIEDACGFARLSDYEGLAANTWLIRQFLAILDFFTGESMVESSPVMLSFNCQVLRACMPRFSGIRFH